MPRTLDPELRSALAARIRYYNEMGIYDFYRQPVSDRAEGVAAPIAVDEEEIAVSTNQPESGEEMSPRKSAAVAVPVVVEENIFEAIADKLICRTRFAATSTLVLIYCFFMIRQLGYKTFSIHSNNFVFRQKFSVLKSYSKSID